MPSCVSCTSANVTHTQTQALKHAVHRNGLKPSQRGICKRSHRQRETRTLEPTVMPTHSPTQAHTCPRTFAPTPAHTHVHMYIHTPRMPSMTTHTRTDTRTRTRTLLPVCTHTPTHQQHAREGYRFGQSVCCTDRNDTSAFPQTTSSHAYACAHTHTLLTHPHILKHSPTVRGRRLLLRPVRVLHR